MKEDKIIHQPTGLGQTQINRVTTLPINQEVAAQWVSHVIKLGLLLLFLCSVRPVQAQCSFDNSALNPGENTVYSIYFKWGLLMPKAGEATISYHRASFEQQPGYRYWLLLRTTGLFESIYPMRDTLLSYYDNNMKLLVGEKRANEKNYYSVDHLRFSYDNGVASARSIRHSRSILRFDTTLISDIPCALDMMSTLMYLRSLDWNKMQVGDRFHYRVLIGRAVVKVYYQYKGQAIVERDDFKYRTRLFTMGVIYDDLFEDQDASAEIWVGDDPNRIPIKIRAKLKIGAAEAHFKESSELKYPLTCRIKVPRR